jgi:hypothetical protein
MSSKENLIALLRAAEDREDHDEIAIVLLALQGNAGALALVREGLERA